MADYQTVLIILTLNATEPFNERVPFEIRETAAEETVIACVLLVVSEVVDLL